MTGAKSILLVDDDSDDQFLFREALKCVDDSLHLHIAKHGLEALELLNSLSQLPELIFLDINMPVMDGFECLQYLKSIVALKDIPVIILTTSSTHMHQTRAFSLGAESYVVKPMVFEELARELEVCYQTYTCNSRKK